MNRTLSRTFGTILIGPGLVLGAAATAAPADDSADALIAQQVATLLEARFGPLEADERHGRPAPGDVTTTSRSAHVAEIAALTEHLTGVPCPVPTAAPYARLAWCLDVLIDDAAASAPAARWGTYYRAPHAADVRPISDALAHIHAQLERAMGVIPSTDLGDVRLQSGTIGWPSESGYFVLPASTEDGDFTFVPETDAADAPRSTRAVNAPDDPE